MTLQSSVRKVTKNLFLAGFAAFATISLAIAATIGYPFTEDFSDDTLKDATLTSADWDIATGTLQLALTNALTDAPLSRDALGGLGEVAETSRDIVLGDLDGDGDLDAVVGNEGVVDQFGPTGGVNLIYENNNGLFNIAPIDLGTSAEKTRGLAIGDIDNDGDLDIVAGNYQGPGVYYLNDGTGNLSSSNFTAGTPFTNQTRRTWKVGLVDVDSDGDLDYIEGNDNAVNSLYLNELMETGSLGFSDEIRITGDRFFTRSITFGDIDNDGDTDIIAGDQGVGNHVYRWFNGQFTVNNPVVHDNTNATFAVALADLNGDGYLDVVEGNSGLATQIYFNQGAANPGFFGGPTALNGSIAEHTTVALILRDMDRDGDIDIVEGNNGVWDDDGDEGIAVEPTPRVAQPLRVFLNNGDGSFASGASYNPPEVQKIYGMYAGDVDSDGKLDFVTATSINNDGGPDALAGNAVYYNDGVAGPNVVRQLDGVAVSTAGIDIDGQNSAIRTARLTVTKVQPAVLTDLDFFVSNDNGGSYVPIRPGIPVAFPNQNGTQLRWKVEMLSGSPNTAQLARINQLTIGPNGRPVFDGGPDQSGVEGQQDAIDLSLYFSDPDGDALSYAVSGLPAGTGLSLNPKTGLLSGVYTNADAVASPITLVMSAFDGAESRNGSILLTVTNAINDVPTANDDGPYPVDEGGAIVGAFNVLDNDTDPENEPLSAVLVDPPAEAALFELRPDGTFDYTHNGSETVSDSFTYRAADAANQSNVATVSITITPVNDAPVISLIGAATVNLVVGDSYSEAGATADDAEDGDISADIVIAGDTVDTSTVGQYAVTYNVVDSEGLAATQVTRTVNVTTNNPPVITLLGSNSITLTVGDTFTDPGATAQDVEDGDISASIVTGGAVVDTNTVGTYVITYNVTDSDGNAAVPVTRTVNVVADAPPVITLVGSAAVTLTVGGAYTEQGATAADPEDGDISDQIVVGGDTVNTSVAGTYVVTYNVTDSAGNAAAQVTRTVTVNAAPPPPPSGGGGGGGSTGIAELFSLLFAGLIAARRRRSANRLG